MALETIKEINNPAFKTGMGKNGKPWTMMQITTDRNNMASVFAPANVGDKVEMTWNEQYGNWSAKKVNAQEQAQLEAMRKLYELNLAIYEVVAGHPYGKAVKVEPTVAPTAAQLPIEHIESTNYGDDEEISLSDIPF
jgi:hypothetical protein